VGGLHFRGIAIRDITWQLCATFAPASVHALPKIAQCVPLPSLNAVFAPAPCPAQRAARLCARSSLPGLLWCARLSAIATGYLHHQVSAPLKLIRHPFD
jgi:hypothetical protein